MMFDYGATADTAKRLIANFGMPMTIIRVEHGEEYIPGEGYPEVITRTDFLGVRTAPKVQEIQAGVYNINQVVILMPGDTVPDVSTADRIEFGGRLWDIESVSNIAPAETVVLRKIGVVLSSQSPTPPETRKRA